MKRSQLVVLSMLSGLLMYAAWPPSIFTFPVFFAWVPLLQVEKNENRPVSFFFLAFLSMLIWNLGTTWWIWNATDIGSIAAIIANSLLMCIPWWGLKIFHKRYGKTIGYVAFICFYLTFEFVHLNWQLSWPWLNLGNIFSDRPEWIQWYAYTGVQGGTTWIIISNMIIFELLEALLHKNSAKHKRQKWIVASMITILLPIGISLIMLKTKHAPETGKENIVVVQPNIDPYEKFGTLSPEEQIEKLVRLSELARDTATSLVVWPETAMDASLEESQTDKSPIYEPVFNFLNKHPSLSLISGIETFKDYGFLEKKPTPTARKLAGGAYIDAYNAAVLIKHDKPLMFYHKSRLVPGVECLPDFLNFMAPVFEKFGGTTGGYGRDSTSRCFPLQGSAFIAAPVICYESIYGEYVSSYIKKGANLITIMTNDAWWGNTPGYKQHLSYARLRAIETGLYVVRSANTGISAVIDPQGQILQATRGFEQTAFNYRLPKPDKKETFYVRYGDYLYKLSGIITILLLVLHLINLVKIRFYRR